MREPVYNYIYYNEELEKKLIDTEYIQRLRRLYQLPTARFVYPGANHSRFLHSLGVMHLAGEFTEKLLNDTDIDADEKSRITEGARITGLLHDVGHGPFSHTFDEAIISRANALRSKGIHSHEDISRLIIEKSEIKDILDEWCLEKLVKDIFLGKEELPLLLRSISRVFRKWLFTADVLDFLVRDAYFCGIRSWGVDVERIMHWTKIYEGDLASENRVLPSIYSYLLSRFQMFENVYFHRTARAIDCMLREIFQKASPFFKLIERIEKCEGGDFTGFVELTDYSILDMIRHYNVSTDKNLQEAKELVKMILTRNIPIRLLDEFGPSYGSIEADILDRLERKYTDRGNLLLSELLEDVKREFLSQLEQKGYTKNVSIYVDYTDVRYLSDYPLSWFGDLPVYDRRTGDVSIEPIISKFLDRHRFPFKKITIYADKGFEQKYGKDLKDKGIFRKVLAKLAETKTVVL